MVVPGITHTPAFCVCVHFILGFQGSWRARAHIYLPGSPAFWCRWVRIQNHTIPVWSHWWWIFSVGNCVRCFPNIILFNSYKNIFFLDWRHESAGIAQCQAWQPKFISWKESISSYKLSSDLRVYGVAWAHTYRATWRNLSWGWWEKKQKKKYEYTFLKFWLEKWLSG